MEEDARESSVTDEQARELMSRLEAFRWWRERVILAMIKVTGQGVRLLWENVGEEEEILMQNAQSCVCRCLIKITFTTSPTAFILGRNNSRGWDSPHNRINRTIGNVFCSVEEYIKAASHPFWIFPLQLSSSSSFPSTTDNQIVPLLTSL